MSNLTATSQLFIPFGQHDGNFTSSYFENNSHLRNINNMTVFDSNRIKRRRRDGQMRNVLWQKRDFYSPGAVGLHEEVVDFYDTMSPIREEKEIRSKVVEHIHRTVLSLWPKAKVGVFGSFNTGLYLPTSDIDIVVTGKWDSLPLQTLKTALVKSGIAENNITVLSQAAVPIVRFVQAPTSVKVDISFNVPNGLKSAEFIKESIQLYPDLLPKLVLVLKQFLLHRQMNEVYYGGMSSYAITLLVISFLQKPHKPDALQATNLGTLLMEFFEHFGKNFNYEKVSISVKNGGRYNRKVQPWLSYLSIEDPLCETNDIARGTFLMRDIQNAFENAYNTLHKALTEDQDIRQQSLLKLILDVNTDLNTDRQTLMDNFDDILKHFTSDHKRVSKTEDWKENVAKPLLPSTGRKDPVINLNESSEIQETMKNGECLEKDKNRPLQKTRIFYGSRQFMKDTGSHRSFNYATNSNRIQPIVTNCSAFNEDKVAINGQQNKNVRKANKNSKRNFKQVNNNYKW